MHVTPLIRLHLSGWKLDSRVGGGAGGNRKMAKWVNGDRLGLGVKVLSYRDVGLLGY
jgi:hypothetical protein